MRKVFSAILVFPLLIMLLGLIGGGFAGGCSKDALKMYQDRVKKDPKNPQHHNDLAYYLSNELKQYDEAIKEYDKAIELRPGDLIARSNKAYILYQMQKYPESLKLFLILVKEFPTRTDINSNVAMCYHQLKQYGPAYEFYTRSLELSDKNLLAKEGMNILMEDIKKANLTVDDIKKMKWVTNPDEIKLKPVPESATSTQPQDDKPAGITPQ